MAAFAPVRTQVLQLLVGMFNAAPGKNFLNEFAAFVEAVPAGTDPVVALANELASKAAFSNIHPRFQTGAEFAATVLANLGLTGNQIGTDFIVAQFNAGTPKGAIIARAVSELAAFNGTDAQLLAAKAQLANKVDVSTYYSVTKGVSSVELADLQGALAGVTGDAASVANARTAIDEVAANAAGLATQLTTGRDNISGSFQNDNFVARIIDNENTLQSGDVIRGSAGIDTLTADIGTSQNFAITPETNSIEIFKVRAQATDISGNPGGGGASTTGDNNGTNNGENNIGAAAVQIDAERMLAGKTAGNFVQRFESNNSRADVIIEDVRLGAAADITKDVTIAFTDSDPGNVDFAVYFDQPSLRFASGTTASTAQIQLRDGLAASATPLGNLTVNGIRFILGGVTFNVQNETINAATTYQQFVTAFNAQLATLAAANPALVGVSASVGAAFANVNNAPNSDGNFIVISDAQGRTFGAPNTTQALFSDNPPSGAFTLLFNPTANPATPTRELITSTIVLDNVGRGSTGGDLVVGGLSAGQTSTSIGVERFDIRVEDNSALQQVESTNDALREVYIVNAANSAGNSNGNLTVRGNATNSGNNVAGGAGNNALPGSTTHGDAYGFNEVRVIDGSAMTGNLNFTAALSNNAVSKFLNVADQAPAQPAADNPDPVSGKQFEYRSGAGSDTIQLDIGSGNLDKAGTTTREDFVLTVDGGAGNDAITVRITDGLTVNGGAGTLAAGQNSNSAWYINSKINANLSINAGAGNDTVTLPGGGDFNVDLGAGDDVFYADAISTERGAANATVDQGFARFVFNTQEQVLAGARARNVDDLLSDTNESFRLFNANLTLDFKGITTTVAVPFNNTTYRTTDLQINQAIKLAVNANAVLNKLIVAEDGPGNVLIIRSLIDGQMVQGDLTIALTQPAVSANNATLLSNSDVAAAAAAYGLTGAAATPQAVLDILTQDLNLFRNFGDYTTAFAHNGTLDANNNVVNLTGANSVFVGDTRVTVGEGNDVVVLGTAQDGALLANDSNDTVVFAGNFGNDTIVNFSTAGLNSGGDQLDFSSYLGGAAAAFQGLIGATAATEVLNRSVITLDYSDLGITGLGETFNNLTEAKVLAALNANNNAAFRARGFEANNVNNSETFVLLVADNQGGVGAPNPDNRVKVFSGTTSSGVTAANVANISFATVVERGVIDFADLDHALATENVDQNPGSAALATLVAANFGINAETPVQPSFNLNGLAGNDTIAGTDGDDVITGGTGNDSLSGGLGADTISGDAGADTIVGGAGVDEARVVLATTAATTTAANTQAFEAERIDLGVEANDRVVITNFARTTQDTNIPAGNITTREVVVGFVSATVGDATSNAVRLVEAQQSNVGAVAANIFGGTFAQIDDEGTILTGATFHVVGTDAAFALSANQDRGNAFSVVALGTNGADTAASFFAGTDGNDYVNAGAGADNIATGLGNDFLVGGGDNDTLNGGLGDDSFIGGAGADSLTGGGGTDLFINVNGNASTFTFAQGAPAAGTTLVPQAGNTFTGADVITDLTTGDTLNLGNANATADAGVVGTLQDNEFLLVSGTYVANTGVFTIVANGADSAVLFDQDSATAGVQQGVIVLVGVSQGEAAGIQNAAGALTVFGA
jgi:hypothetical protein